MAKLLSNKTHVASLLLRIGLAVIFLYAAISSFVSPQDWIGYLPQFAKKIISGDVLLKIFSVYELGLVVWLLSGKYIKYAAGLAALTLGGIVLSNFSLFVITFRDIALIFAAIALAVLNLDKDA